MFSWCTRLYVSWPGWRGRHENMSYRSCWRIFSLVTWEYEMHYFMKLHYSIDLTSKLSLLEKYAENKMMKKLEINQPGYVCQGRSKPIKWVHFSYLRNLVLSNFRIFNKSNMLKKKKKKKKKKKNCPRLCTLSTIAWFAAFFFTMEKCNKYNKHVEHLLLRRTKDSLATRHLNE